MLKKATPSVALCRNKLPKTLGSLDLCKTPENREFTRYSRVSNTDEDPRSAGLAAPKASPHSAASLFAKRLERPNPRRILVGIETFFSGDLVAGWGLHGSAATTARTLVLMPDLERGPGTLAVSRLVAVAQSAARPRYRVFKILRCQAEPRINTTTKLCLN